MFTFDVTKHVPRFILQDKNGYAVAKAIEAAVQMMNDTIQQGVDCVDNCEKMPEWRLDEMAWEYNIPYDYNADIEIKRGWVRNVYALSRLYGTPDGIIQYMTGYFGQTTLQEAWEYDGEPFHFRVLFPDSWTPEKVTWATMAIEMVKNVRSVLDRYIFDGKWRKNLYAGCALYAGETGIFQVPKVEMDAVDWYIDENGDMLLDENGILLIVEE